MSKELEQSKERIKIDECAVGDVCWMVTKWANKPYYGEIVSIIKEENAVMIQTAHDGFRTALCDHCFWDEKSAKAFKKNVK